MQPSSEFRNRVANMPLSGEDDPYLDRWLQPETILCDVEADDMAALFDLAANEIARTHGLEAGPVLRALTRREQSGSTSLGTGFAIPHARIAGIDEPLTLLVRLGKPIDFDAPDGAEVGLFMFIMVPLGDHHAHLQLLAAIAQVFSDRAFRHALDNAPDVSVMAAVMKAGIAGITR